MIVVKLLGGLGNQMFQYALGRQLATLNNTQLYLDLSDLNKRGDDIDHTYRNFELSIFKSKYKIKKNDKIADFFTKLYFKITSGKLIQENGHQFNDQVFIINNNLYLTGFWQSEKYFKNIETVIRDEFTFMPAIDHLNSEILKNIDRSNSVSIHFRRGDYVTNSSAKEFHGECEPDYYEKAISIIKQKVNNPHFFIFSDEIDWVKSNYQFIDDHSFVNINSGDKSFEDMRLMSRCKHNIIANSSFSWWGAWLNANAGKEVIAPLNWFADKSINTSDIIPIEWTVI